MTSINLAFPVNLSNNSPKITEIPEELLVKIFGFLRAKDLARVAGVCKTFNRISNDERLWKPFLEDLSPFSSL